MLYIYRRFYLTEYELFESREAVWSMLGFASITFIMSIIGIYVAAESKRMKEEDCWDFVDLSQIKTEDKNRNHKNKSYGK